MKRNKQGFTLIELLAVIVIIAIIALIGIPSVTRILTNSRLDALKDSGINIANAAKLKLSSNDLVVPESTGCVVLWNDLDMESDRVSAGAVDTNYSYVSVTVDPTTKKYDYAVWLVLQNSKGGIAGENVPTLTGTAAGEGRNAVVLGSAVTSPDPLNNGYVNCITGEVMGGTPML